MIRWLLGQTRQTAPPAWTTEAGAWRVYPAHEVPRGPQEPWRVVIPAVPPAVAAHYGQFHLPPTPALDYAAMVFYLVPHGAEQVAVHGVRLEPALAAYYHAL